MLNLAVPMDGMSTSIEVDDVSGGGKHEFSTNGTIRFQGSFDARMFFKVAQGHARIAPAAVPKILLPSHTAQLATFAVEDTLGVVIRP